MRDERVEPLDDDYVRYLRTEWNLFDRDPSRARAALETVGNAKLARVLDVGCGAAQELLPFLETRDVLGVAVDKVGGAGVVARHLFADRRLVGRMVFVQAQAEHLPCRSSSFDLVICRLVLPYTSNANALAEMARVLREGGMIVLQFHHARFYVWELIRAIRHFKVRAAVHNLVVLVAGATYWATGAQPRTAFVAEVFQTVGTLKRELARHGLQLREVLPNSNPSTPSVIVLKE